MSEHQYYEFCSVRSPLTPDARKEMRSLSSRAHVTTHGAYYVYNYGDFRGKPKQLLLKYFDVFFYIANWGTIQLMFKYDNNLLDINAIRPYCIDRAITCEQHEGYVVLDIQLHDEENCFHADDAGELLPDLLPLYDEIKEGNDQFLKLASIVHAHFDGEKEDALDELQTMTLSAAQKTFLESMGI